MRLRFVEPLTILISVREANGIVAVHKTPHATHKMHAALTPFRILSFLFAPRFCETNVELEIPSVISGMSVIAKTFRAEMCPAIIIVSKLLMADCSITEPELTSALINAIESPCPVRSL